ncbi:methyltransferase [Porphyromonas canoris]|uniref:Methyltransferase n=1 Tax=Porphyromonas canoris TaxID=36875 RepID=A0ABR4XK57_9PORP|nr:MULTISPECIES: RsmD family RNA methyltransferase [Porphyromonas]KGL52868.1 methyltransferase [Porphyromonas canoris]KGN91845.1 methyltransferase [Porphyromonas canoris]KGN95572.1 methyltransferase [Porphyromonas sp. COT-108 OH2963]
MRIIRGKYGKRRFEVPSGFKARPTTDFAKENLFNVLENIFDWDGKSVLDLFAGTGSIGLEFLSRGCRSVVAVEKDKRHYLFLQKLADTLKDPAYRPILSDAFRFIESRRGSFDIVFADPPYALDNIEEIPDLLIKHGTVHSGSTIIIEHPGTISFSSHPCFYSHKVYGSVNFSILFVP